MALACSNGRKVAGDGGGGGGGAKTGVIGVIGVGGGGDGRVDAGETSVE